MSILIQHQFSFVRPLAARVRSVRRPFNPTPAQGNYRLPHEICDRLALALAPYKNRDAAFTLAIFLARFWSVPGRVAGLFPIDRRAVADHANLGLSEARVRGAIKALEAVGYIARGIPASGSRYKRSEHGLRRKPILFGFGADYAAAFLAANNRAQKARGGLSRARRSIMPTSNLRPSSVIAEPRTLKSPISKSQAKPKVLIGHLAGENGQPSSPIACNALEAALARLKKAIDLAKNRENGD